MDQSTIEVFRQRYRMTLLEKLVLKTAFLSPIQSGHLSSEESRSALRGWLNLNKSIVDGALGEHSHDDPGTISLYADEVKSMIDSMNRTVEALYDEYEAIRIGAPIDMSIELDRLPFPQCA